MRTNLRAVSVLALLTLAGCVVAPSESVDEPVASSSEELGPFGDCPPWAPWAGGCATSIALPHVLTQHNDTSRTGWNHFERALDTSDLRATQFGKLATWTVDGQVYAQPLYVSRGAGQRDLVVVATEHNVVYGFDPDVPGDSPTPVWRRYLGTPYRVRPLGNAFNINVYPEMGVTSTPVIDLATRSIFLVSLQMGDHVTPRGTLETRRLPGDGAGPSPERLFIGSEGVLGVITEAWMKLLARPRFRARAKRHPLCKQVAGCRKP